MAVLSGFPVDSFDTAIRPASGRVRWVNMSSFAYPWESEAIPLTPREHKVLMLLVEGGTTKQIAQTLVISLATVSNHVRQKRSATYWMQLAAFCL